MKNLRKSTGFAVLLVVLAASAGAENWYYWADSRGEHFTRDRPPAGTIFMPVTMPDNRSWDRPPPLMNEITGDKALSSQELYRRVSGAVYWIRSKSRDKLTQRSVYGSAVAISDTDALTNCHVALQSGDELSIGSGKQDEEGEASLEAVDIVADRCVIRTRDIHLQPVSGVRRYDSLEIGETIYAIGNPRKLERTLSNGLVSGKRDDAEPRVVQFTAAISHGSSGGGLFDAHGNLVGITSYTIEDSQGLNFAIPAEDYWKQ
jgi:S1-C subfamily serine protease